jgi:hypothetical protein
LSIGRHFIARPFLVDLWVEWLRQEWPAVALISGFIAAGIAFGLYVFEGTPIPERARVVGFESYANQVGDHPIVVVRMADGSERQVPIPTSSLRRCKIGSTIRLLRWPHTIDVAPEGCAIAKL